jgi:RimJ/RimL family protein N-acetyltransferase
MAGLTTVALSDATEVDGMRVGKFQHTADAPHRGCRVEDRVCVRDLTPEDEAALDAVFEGMSPHSRYLRFHGPLPRLSGSMRKVLLNVDGQTHVALVAEVRTRLGWRPIGLARFVRTEPGRAELAVEVVDAWQGRGIGRRLLQALRDRAMELGYLELYGEVLVENEAVIGLLQKVFPAARLESSGISGTVICPLIDQPARLAPTDAFSAAIDRSMVGVG